MITVSKSLTNPDGSGPIPIRLSLHDSIHLTNKEHWNTIAESAGLYLQYDHLLVLEDQMADAMEFRYAIFYCEQFKPIGLAYFQSVDFIDNGSDYQANVCRIGKGIGAHIISDMKVRCLVSGNVFHTGEYGFHFAVDLPLDEQTLLIQSTLQRLIAEKRMDPKPSLAIFKEFQPANFDASEVLETKRYHKLRLDVNMALDIRPEWTSLDAYREDLRAKSRTRFKNILKKSSALEMRSLTAKQIRAELPRMRELFQQVLDRSPYMFEGLDVGVYAEWKELHKSKMMLHGFFLDGQMVGFNAGFLNGDALDAHYVGVDYDLNKKLLIYQRLLIDSLEFAISKGVKRINFGRTAEQAKSTLGALPEDLLLYIKHRSRIANKMIKPFIASIKPSEFEMREPFKKLMA